MECFLFDSSLRNMVSRNFHVTFNFFSSYGEPNHFSAEFSFTTPPPVAATSAVEVLLLADAGTDLCNYVRELQEIERKDKSSRLKFSFASCSLIS